MAPPIIVTGAAGFIGMHTCRRLLSDGATVVGVDNLNDYYDPALKEARIQELLYLVRLKERQDDNKRRDRQASILGALGLPEDGHVLTGEEVDQLFAERHDVPVVTGAGRWVENASELAS